MNSKIINNVIVPDVSACLPCAGRPMRTRRILDHLSGQTKKGFELLLVGDACPDFEEMINSEWFKQWSSKFLRLGNHLVYYNLPEKGGGYGAAAINWAISHARGKYFCFLGNDDIIAAEHIEFYYLSIETADFRSITDFVINKTLLNSGHGFFERDPELRFGCVGHSELVIKTSFLKMMPPHDPEHGHDWRLIENMINSGAVHAKGKDIPFPTYFVMGTPTYRETEID